MNKKSFSGHDMPEAANLPVAPLTPDDNEFYALCGFIDDIFLLPERRERIVKLAQDNHLPIFMVVNMVEPYLRSTILQSMTTRLIRLRRCSSI